MGRKGRRARKENQFGQRPALYKVTSAMATELKECLLSQDTGDGQAARVTHWFST